MTPGAAGEQSFSFTPKDPIPPVKQTEKKEEGPLTPSTRKEWLREWEKNNPGRVLPCSAKAAYRLADSGLTSLFGLSAVFLMRFLELDLKELKARAFQVRYIIVEDILPSFLCFNSTLLNP